MKKLVIIFIFLLGVLLRFIFLFAGENQLGGYVEALLAKYILLGKTLPLSYPMVHYGDILTPYLAAFMFRIFGVSICAYHLPVILFYSLPTVILVYFLSKKISKSEKVSFLSILFMALAPATNFYTLHQLAIFLAPLILFLSCMIIFEELRPKALKKKHVYSILGLVIGIGLWNELILLPHIIIGLLFLWAKDRNKDFKNNFFLLIIFAIFGCLPYIIYNIIHPFACLMRLGGYMLGVDRSILQEQSIFFILLSKILQKIMYIPKATLEALYALKSALGLDRNNLGFFVWLGLPLAMLYTVSFLYVSYTRRRIFIDLFRFRLKVNQIEAVDILLFTVIFVYITSAIFGFYGWWRMAQYYPLLVIFISMFLSSLWRRFRIISIILIILVLLVNLISNTIVLKRPAPPYRCLITFLETNGLHAGYSNALIAYAVNFISDEKIIISPTASIKDIGFVEFGLEWPEHKRVVESAKNICYILPIKKERWYIQIMHKRLQDMGINYKTMLIPPFYVFYEFSRKPLPRELNLPPLRDTRL